MMHNKNFYLEAFQLAPQYFANLLLKSSFKKQERINENVKHC